MGQLDEALTVFQKALEIDERLAHANPAVTTYQDGLAGSYNNIGIVHRLSGNLSEALTAYQSALEIEERLARENPAVTKHQIALAGGYSSVGRLYLETDKPDEARAAYQTALEIEERLARKYPAVIDYSVDLAGSYINQGNLVRGTGNPEEALSWYRRAIDKLEGLQQPVAQDTTAQLFLCKAHWDLAETFDRLQRHAEAVDEWKRAMDLGTEQYRPSIRLGFAFSLAGGGDHARAAREANRLIDQAAEQPDGPDFYDVARVFSLASAAAANDDLRDEQRRTKLVEDYAAKALNLLDRARAAGYFEDAANVERIKQDPHLAPLRKRDDFQKLLGRIE